MLNTKFSHCRDSLTTKSEIFFKSAKDVKIVKSDSTGMQAVPILKQFWTYTFFLFIFFFLIFRVITEDYISYICVAHDLI